MAVPPSNSELTTMSGVFSRGRREEEVDYQMGYYIWRRMGGGGQ